MIPLDHPRYRSLVTREHLVAMAVRGVIAPEGLIAHGRGEAFDYLLGESSTESAHRAARCAAALLRTAKRPVFSVNGNTAALAAKEIAVFQETTGIPVEVNLFHRTPERVEAVTSWLAAHGVRVLSGVPERLVPLSHDRGLCLPSGIGAADLVIVPLEDGDRCGALKRMGKTVITIDLNPLSRTARTADLTIVDEVTRAIPLITAAWQELARDTGSGRAAEMVAAIDNRVFLAEALQAIGERCFRALD